MVISVRAFVEGGGRAGFHLGFQFNFISDESGEWNGLCHGFS